MHSEQLCLAPRLKLSNRPSWNSMQNMLLLSAKYYYSFQAITLDVHFCCFATLQKTEGVGVRISHQVVRQRQH